MSIIIYKRDRLINFKLPHVKELHRFSTLLFVSLPE